MTTPRADIPYHWIRGLPLEVQREIELNFLTLGQAIDNATGPFIVVADDGTGDFTSIKTAIETCSASVTPGSGNAAFNIYVKPPVLGTWYSDVGLGQVNMGSTDATVDIHLFGPNIGSNGIPAILTGSSVAQGVHWKCDGLKWDSSDGFFLGSIIIEALIASLVVENLYMTFGNGAGGLVQTNSGTNQLRIWLKNCYVDGYVVANVACPTRLTLEDTTCTLAIFAGTSVLSCPLAVRRCLLGAGWIVGSAVMNVGGSTYWVLTDNIVRGQVSTTLRGNGGSQNGSLLFARNECVFSGVITIDHPDTGATYNVSDNYGNGDSGGGGGWVFIGGGDGPQITFADNSAGWTLHIGNAGLTASSGVRISGLYGDVICDADNALIDIVVGMANAAGHTGLTLTGRNCVALVGIERPGAGCVGVNVSGNDNIISGGFLAVPTPAIDTGLRNIINGALGGVGLPTSTQDFRHDFLGSFG